MFSKNPTGERLEQGDLSQSLAEHLHRYKIAEFFCTNKVVLDIACGEGYGSNLLSKFATKVSGVDIDANSIAEASLKYKSENIEFKEGNTSNIPYENSLFDVVVSFETIEHHNQHHEMLKEIKRVLKPGGLLIISTPDKHIYTDLKGTKNKFHIKELYKKEFVELINIYFTNATIFNQKFITGSYIYADTNSSERSMIWYNGNFEQIQKTTKPEGEYTIAIASDEKISIPNEVEKESFFLETNFINKLIAQYKNLSIRYKVGYAILSPLRIIKNIVNAFLKP
jgi:ubiquinone/menaquinone biosynthesis C-methylase UbiE